MGFWGNRSIFISYLTRCICFFFSSFHEDAVEDGSDNMIELKNAEFNKYFKKNCNNSRSFDFELIENFQFMESTD